MKLSAIQKEILARVANGENIPHGRTNHSASLMSAKGWLMFVNYGGPKEGVTYTLTVTGIALLTEANA